MSREVLCWFVEYLTDRLVSNFLFLSFRSWVGVCCVVSRSTGSPVRIVCCVTRNHLECVSREKTEKLVINFVNTTIGHPPIFVLRETWIVFVSLLGHFTMGCLCCFRMGNALVCFLWNIWISLLCMFFCFFFFFGVFSGGLCLVVRGVVCTLWFEVCRIVNATCRGVGLARGCLFFVR